MRRDDPCPVDLHPDAVLLERDVAHLDTVPELRSGSRGLLDEIGVEPLPLRHQDERFLHAALDPAGEVEPEPHARRPVLDHRVDRERQLADGAHREPAATRLVARERGLVGQQDATRLRLRDDTQPSIQPAPRQRRGRQSAPQTRGYNADPPWGEFPSGQRGRAVNPLAQPSEVRILSPPFPRAFRRARKCPRRPKTARTFARRARQLRSTQAGGGEYFGGRNAAPSRQVLRRVDALAGVGTRPPQTINSRPVHTA